MEPRSLYRVLSQSAACRNEDPHLFTSTDWADHVKARTGYCLLCPVTKLCLTVVRPRQSWFDGTAGSLYWLNGVNMTVRMTSVTFTSWGEYDHYRVGSWRVRDALAGRRDPRSLSHGETMLYAYAACEAGLTAPQVAEILGVSQHAVRMMAPVVARDAPSRVLEASRTWRVRDRAAGGSPLPAA